MGMQVIMANAVANEKAVVALYADLFANRPPFGQANRYFFSTDTGAIYLDTGAAWVLFISSGSLINAILNQSAITQVATFKISSNGTALRLFATGTGGNSISTAGGLQVGTSQIGQQRITLNSGAINPADGSVIEIDSGGITALLLGTLSAITGVGPYSAKPILETSLSAFFINSINRKAVVIGTITDDGVNLLQVSGSITSLGNTITGKTEAPGDNSNKMASTAFVAANSLVNPMTTLGDTIHGGAAGVPTRLPLGTTNVQVLGVNHGVTDVEWKQISPGNGIGIGETVGNIVIVALDQVNNASDANFTVNLQGGQVVNLPVITANRNCVMPSPATLIGQTIKVWNKNSSGFAWTFTGSPVVNAASVAVTTQTNQRWYIMESDGANWNVQN